MLQKEVQISSGFKRQATKVILSILLFLVTYFIIFCLALALTGICVYGGILLIITIPKLITIVLGIGIASLGFLILFFLIKFVFKSNKVDRSNLMEIYEDDEPKLFEMLHDIVDQVGTSFPKKVYLSPDVNASVFYDSSFWSMFLPVRKNLMIGMGLVNSISEEELKGILSHEFGHFSQKTMKVGSYVYNLNQIIFNMLFDNESYEKIIMGWASASGFFTIFVSLAVYLIQAIQWILQQLYALVNKSYMGLSREMEFHADEIAAHITGYKPLKRALLRMNLADHSYNTVLSLYQEKYEEQIKSHNIFKEQYYVMQIMAKKDELDIKDGLPQNTLEKLNKFNKSKLIVEDQWASHPSMEDRIERLENTGIIKESSNKALANDLFTDILSTQEALTDLLFKNVPYRETPEVQCYEDFVEEFEVLYSKNTFAKVFNGYYDNKNTLYFDKNHINEWKTTREFEELFSFEKVMLNYTALSLENDIAGIKQIAYKSVPIKTFDYDGKRYKQKEANDLIIRLNKELDRLHQQILENDKDIYMFFRSKALHKEGGVEKLDVLYQEYFDYDTSVDEKNKIYMELSEKLQFVSYTVPHEVIRANFRAIIPLENKLKNEISEFLSNTKYNGEISADVRANFEKYIAKDLHYFSDDNYQEDNLKILLTALGDYAYVLSKGYFTHKKELLDFKEQLLQA